MSSNTCKVISLQRLLYGKGKKANLSVEKPDKHHLSLVIKVSINNKLVVCILNVMRMACIPLGISS